MSGVEYIFFSVVCLDNSEEFKFHVESLPLSLFSKSRPKLTLSVAGGLRETASEALCYFPGQCWVINLNLRVFSFSLNNREFEILLRSLSPKSPFSGSWSVTTIRLGLTPTHYEHPTLL